MARLKRNQRLLTGLTAGAPKSLLGLTILNYEDVQLVLNQVQQGLVKGKALAASSLGRDRLDLRRLARMHKPGVARVSSKMQAFEALYDQLTSDYRGEKILIFSISTAVLDIVKKIVRRGQTKSKGYGKQFD